VYQFPGVAIPSSFSAASIRCGGRLPNKPLDYVGEPVLITFEAGNHRGEHFIWIEVVQVERMTSIVGEQCKESELRAPIAFTKSVYCI